MYSTRERMNVISELYTILNKNRKQIQDLTSENREIQKRIEELVLNHIVESDTEEEEESVISDMEEEVVKTTTMNRNYLPDASQYCTPFPLKRELADFLGVPVGTLMSRADVTPKMNKYIREHGLQDRDGRKINPDDKLKALFKLDDTMVLSYFNIQRYISQHFVQT